MPGLGFGGPLMNWPVAECFQAQCQKLTDGMVLGVAEPYGSVEATRKTALPGHYVLPGGMIREENNERRQ
jgi:hypothetical protein